MQALRAVSLRKLEHRQQLSTLACSNVSKSIPTHARTVQKPVRHTIAHTVIEHSRAAAASVALAVVLMFAAPTGMAMAEVAQVSEAFGFVWCAELFGGLSALMIMTFSIHSGSWFDTYFLSVHQDSDLNSDMCGICTASKSPLLAEC